MFHIPSPVHIQRETCILVCRSISERCGSEPNLAVCNIEHIVEALKECHAVDEIQTLATRGPDVVDNQINEV